MKDDFKVDRTSVLDTRPPYAPAELAKANSGAVLGVKHDQGKPDLSLVSTELMAALAEVRQWAIDSGKYPRDNWKRGFKFNRSIAAALRHIMQFKDGEDMDGESGLTHIAHAIASLEHLLYDFKHNKSNDDR